MRIRAENLTDVYVPLPGSVRVPGEGEHIAVILSLEDHVVAGVGPADGGGRGPTLACHELGSLTLGPGVELTTLTCSTVGSEVICHRLGNVKDIKVEPKSSSS